VTIYNIWIPGHVGIDGNETADEAAKAAAKERSERVRYPKMKAAQYADIQKETQKEMKMEWEKDKKAKLLHRIMQKRQAIHGRKLYGKMESRKRMTWLVQLRSEHCGLNYYLHRMKKIDEPQCECGKEKETVEHYLLRCERYLEQRKTLRSKIGALGMRIEQLLGHPEFIGPTLDFVADTKRLENQA